MKRKIFLISLATVTLLVVGYMVFYSPTVAEDYVHCFKGITYVDGSRQSGVLVTLLIGDRRYSVTSWTDETMGAGYYHIGSYQDTGDFCLKGRYTVGQTDKGDAVQGTKSSSGTITQDLYLAWPPPECTPWEP